MALTVTACGSPNPTASSAVSPTPAGTQALVALVHVYHDKYVAARGDGYSYCVAGGIDLSKCGDRGTAMIAVWEQFLTDLNSTPVPAKFAADMKTVLDQLPMGINDLKVMVAAAKAGDTSAMLDAANAYVSDMVPTVTRALGDIYAPWATE